MSKSGSYKINFEKYILKNGLQVVLHKDKSTHTVAVATLYHVGSAREQVGKTGFAHLFEHLMFQGSENLKPNEFFTKINDLGGNFNGGTWEDGTIYYEIVPSYSLEKILWMEADRMGFFINSVTQKGLDRELDIVINEKRQVVDNKPYGHTNTLIRSHLYPAGHPYHGSVIGEVEDLKTITLKDVKGFHKKYYSPNNATLVICGNINEAKVKELVDKYFGEIKKFGMPKSRTRENLCAKIDKCINLYHEDKLISVPELRVTFSGAKMYSKDAYALDVLCDLLGDGKNSPMHKEIVLSKNYAPHISISNSLREHAGELVIKVRAYNDIRLQDVLNSINEVLDNFGKSEIDENEINTIKNLAEMRYYDGLSSNLYKAINLAESNVFGGSPKMIHEELNMIQSVTKKDIIRVYNQYFKAQNYITTSFVPIGKKELAVADSVKANVSETCLDEPMLGRIDYDEFPKKIKKTPSKIDRKKEPNLIKKPHMFKLPQIWNSLASNDMKIFGIEDTRLPITYFSIIIKSGSLDDNINKPGIAYLTAKLLRESTAKMNSEELEKAIRDIGASLVFVARKEWCILSGKCISRHFEKLYEIAEDIITQPSWNEDDFARIKKDVLSGLEQDAFNPEKIAYIGFYKALYGEDPIALQNEGTIESVKSIELSDLQEHYKKYFSPTISDIIVSGDIKQSGVLKLTQSLEKKWEAKEVKKRKMFSYKVENEEKTIFINNPNAEQAILFFGRKAIPRSDSEYIPATLINYKLGESSSSILFNVLRLQHGYTYGIYTDFAANNSFGTFIGHSSIDSAVIDNALQIIKQIIVEYPKKFKKGDLEESKKAIIRKISSSYDTLSSYHSLLTEISTYGLPYNFLENDIKAIKDVSYKRAINLIKKYLDIDELLFFVLNKNN